MSTTSNARVRVRHQPRISAAKLGEYLHAFALRRRRILRDQKILSCFMAPRYMQAQNAIGSALAEGSDVKERLRDYATSLNSQVAVSKFARDKNRCCADALRRFADLYDSLNLDELEISRPLTKVLSIHIAEVQVTAVPAVITMRTRKGERQCGGILLVFRKDEALDDHGGKAVCEILRRALVGGGHKNVVPELCLVIDVFSGRMFKAPVRNRQLGSEIEAACCEIALQWASISAA